MTTTTLTKAVRTIIAAATSNAAGATTLGTPVDLRTALGGLITIKTTNGGTLGAQAVISILGAHSASGTAPTAAVANVDWKTLYQVGTGLVASTVNEWSYRVPESVMWVNVVITGNTTNAVTIESFMSEVSAAASA